MYSPLDRKTGNCKLQHQGKRFIRHFRPSNQQGEQELELEQEQKNQGVNCENCDNQYSSQPSHHSREYALYTLLSPSEQERTMSPHHVHNHTDAQNRRHNHTHDEYRSHSNHNKQWRPSLSSSASSTTSPTMQVVILGGSFTGLSVAVALSRDLPRQATQIILVEPKSYLEVRWQTIRAMFDDSTADHTTVPLSKVLGNTPTVTHVKACATEIGIDSVTLDDGYVIPFDVLMIATGAVHHKFSVLTPTEGVQRNMGGDGEDGDNLEKDNVVTKMKEDIGKDMEGMGEEVDKAMARRRKYLGEYGEFILSLETIIIEGGGPVGPELSIELATFSINRGKPVRIILTDTRSELAPSHNRSFNMKLEKKLSSLNIELFLNTELRPHPTSNNMYNLICNSSTKKIHADFVIHADNIVPVVPIFEDDATVGGRLRDGWIKTDANGRVLDTRGNIFAGGDCCDWIAKSGENTLSNRFIYAHNIRLTVEAFACMKPLAAIDGRLKKVNTERNVGGLGGLISANVGNGQGGGAGGGGRKSLDSNGIFGGNVWRDSSGNISRNVNVGRSGSGGAFGGFVLPWMKNRNGFLERAKKDIGW